MNVQETTHIIFSIGIVISTIHTSHVWGKGILKFLNTWLEKVRPATVEPEKQTLDTRNIAPQRKTDRPVCWKVRIGVEQTPNGAKMADIFAVSRRGEFTFRWNRGDQTLLESLEVGIHKVYPHFMAGDNVVVMVPADAQQAFSFETDEPHDKIVVERIKQFLTGHHAGDHKFENVTKVQGAAIPQAQTQQVKSTAPAAQAKSAPAPVVAPAKAASSLPASSPAFDNIDEAANF